MLRVAVVEDETEYRGLIQEMVGRYAKEYDLQIQTTAFPDGRELNCPIINRDLIRVLQDSSQWYGGGSEDTGTG